MYPRSSYCVPDTERTVGNKTSKSSPQGAYDLTSPSIGHHWPLLESLNSQGRGTSEESPPLPSAHHQQPPTFRMGIPMTPKQRCYQEKQSNFRLCTYGPQHESEESSLPSQDPRPSVFQSNVFWALWVMDARVITNHEPLWLKGKHPEFALYWLHKNHIASHWKWVLLEQ